MHNSLNLLWEWFTAPIVCGSFTIAGIGIVFAIIFFTLTGICAEHDHPYPFTIFLALGFITIIATLAGLISFSEFGGGW